MLKRVKGCVRDPEQAEAHRDAGFHLHTVRHCMRWTACMHLRDILVFSTAPAKCDVHMCSQMVCLVSLESHEA